MVCDGICYKVRAVVISEKYMWLNSKLDKYIAKNSGSLRMAFLKLYNQAIASDFIRKVAETFGTRILLIGIGLVTSVIVARILGPEGRGLYAVAMAIGATGVQFGNLGLHASNTYYVARDRTLLPTMVGNILMVSFVLGGIGTGVAWLIFSVQPNLAPVHGLLLTLALAWIPFGLAYMLLQNLLLGMQEVRTYNKIELMNNIFNIMFIVLLIVFRAITVETVFYAGLIMLIISLVWVLLRLGPHLTRLPMPSFVLFKDNIRYGLKAYLAALFAFLVLRIDMLMVKYILGAEETGYYSIAVTMADMIFMLPVVIATILFPKLSAMAHNRDKWKFTRTVVSRAAILMGFFVIIAIFLAEPVIRILYGNAFIQAVPAFIWLLPGIFFLSIQIVAVQFLNSIGFPKIVVLIWGVATLLNVVLNLWMIPKYGIVGASIVSSFSYLIVFIFVMLIIRRAIYETE